MSSFFMSLIGWSIISWLTIGFGTWAWIILYDIRWKNGRSLTVYDFNMLALVILLGPVALYWYIMDMLYPDAFMDDDL